MAYRPSTLAAMSAALGFILFVPMGPAAAARGSAGPPTGQGWAAGNLTPAPAGSDNDPDPPTPAPSALGPPPTDGTHPTAPATTAPDPGLTTPTSATSDDPPGTQPQADAPGAALPPPADAAAPAGLTDQHRQGNPHQAAAQHHEADPGEAAQPSLTGGPSPAPGADSGQAPQAGSRPRVAAGGTIESPPASPNAVDAAGWTPFLPGREIGIRIFFGGLVALIFSIAGLVTVAIRRRMW